MPRVLVFGATGFVGQRLVAALEGQGHEVHRTSRKAKGERLHQGDICDGNFVREVLELVRPECVFHLAAMISYKKRDRNAMYRINVEGTRLIAEACMTLDIFLLYCSSVVTVGAATDPSGLLNEESTYNLREYDSGYCETKKEAEDLLLEYCSANRLRCVIVNPSNVYGYGDAEKGSRKTQIRVAQGRFPLYPTGGINLVSVEDVCQGVIAAWERGRIGERYILGGDNITAFQLFSQYAAASGASSPWIPIPRLCSLFLSYFGAVDYEKAALSSLYFYFSSNKANTELGYSPKHTPYAIQESVRFMKDKGMLK